MGILALPFMSSVNTLSLQNMKKSFSSVMRAGAFLFLSLCTSQASVLVKDINTTAVSSSAAVNSVAKITVPSGGGTKDVLIMAINDPLSGTELWRTDGTPEGTDLIADIIPGAGSSDPLYLTAVGNRVFFSALSKEQPTLRSLWVTDGTASGTQLLRTFSTGGEPLHLTAFNGRLIFEAKFIFTAGSTLPPWAPELNSGRELWESDGTVAGTKMNANINENPQADAQIRHFLNVNDTTLYFTAVGTAPGVTSTGRELWRMNANFETTLYHDYLPGINSIFTFIDNPELIAVGNSLYYIAALDGEGSELWRSDGSGNTSGTAPVTAIAPGPASAEIRSLKKMTVLGSGGGDFLFFAANDQTTGLELWRSNGQIGSGALTQRMLDINLAANTGSDVNNLTVVGNTLFFTANDGSTGVELWRSNGQTGSGTTRVTNINTDGNSNPSNMTPFDNNKLVFTAVNDSGALGLYFCPTSGNVSGRLANFGTGSTATNFVQLGNRIYFLVNGSQLWSTNAIDEAGTSMVVNFSQGNAGSMVSGATKIGETELYFSATNGVAGPKLWRTDGTDIGTTMVDPTSASSSPTFITYTGAKTYFSAVVSGGDRQLWVTDGTDAGTVIVKKTGDAPINSLGASLPEGLTSIDGILYFSAIGTDGSGNNLGREPWRINASGEAELIADLVTSGSSNPGQFIKVRNTVLFVSGANTQSTRLRPLNTPTIPVQDIAGSVNPGPTDPTNLVLMGTGANQLLYFVGSIANKGNELWHTDGTLVGEETVIKATCIDMIPGPGSSNPSHLTVIGNTLYFAANKGTATPNLDRELWKFTAGATEAVLVKDIVPGTGSSSPEGLIEVDGKLFFTAVTAENGRELWVSNGTPGGTVMIKDIRPGTGSSNITNMANVGGLLVFSADDGIHGQETWVSDGSAAGTVMLEDLAPNAASSSPGEFTYFNGKLFFAAADHLTGFEPRTAAIGSSIEVQQPANNVLSAGQTVEFGQVAFKANETLEFVVKNNGINTMSNVKPLLSGVNASEFSFVAPKVPTTIAPGDSKPMKIRFAPKEGGERLATLSILSNDGASGTYVLQLRGVGEKDPYFTSHPASLIRYVGESANFSATVTSTGSGTLAYQWKKSGNISGATSSSLSIPTVTLKDGGAYTLFVKGSQKGQTAVSNPGQLAVVYNQPEMVLAASAGKTASIKVSASGNGLTYQWLKGVSPVSNNSRVSGAQSATLVIKNLEAGDTGLYTCSVSNGAGSRVGGTTRLNIFDLPPETLADQDMPDGIVSGSYYHKIKINEDPRKAALSYAAKGLPAGLKLNTKTGEITGRPTKPGTYKVVLTAKNTFNPPAVTPEQTVVIDAFPEGVEGIYAGTVAHQSVLNQGVGGRLDVTVSKTGSFSGSLTMGGTRLPLKGGIDVFRTVEGEPPVNPIATVNLTPPAKSGLPAMVVVFELEPATGLLTPNSKVIAGSNQALITGWRRVGASEAAGYMGYYTFGLQLGDESQVGTANEEKVPQGWSYGSFKVAKDGKLSFTGRTADGEKITGASFIGQQGRVVFFQTLYAPTKGSLLGSLTVEVAAPADVADNSLTGDVLWVRPAGTSPKTRAYQDGFGLTGTAVETPVPLEAFGSIFIKPSGLVLGLTSPGTVDLDFFYAGLSTEEAEDRVNAVPTIREGNKIGQDTTQPTTILKSINTSTGLYTGTFTLSDPGVSKPLVRKVTYQGILINDVLGTPMGVGNFMLPKLPGTQDTLKTTDVLSGKVEIKPTSTTPPPEGPGE